MRKLGAIFLFVYLAACSTVGTVVPTITADVPHTATPVPTQTSVPPTYTPAPAPTTMPAALPTAMGGGAGKIAFTSERDGYLEIYVINVDGSGLIKLANNITPKFNPSWSPDGKKIAIQIVHYVGCCARHSKNYVINANGSNLEVVDQPDGFSAPVWSPDSQKIAFDGSVWSPDGKKIAFATDWGRDAAIHVMDADGTNPVRLTHSGSPWDHAPSWSPNGSKITFLSYRDGNYEIYIVNADGTNLLNLTKNPVDEGGQVWSPDGTKIAFVSAHDGNPGIFVIDIDGTNLIRLTISNSDYSLAWSP